MDDVMRVPTLGAEDTIMALKWLVEVGQMIDSGPPLVVVETDKSIMELESILTTDVFA